MSIDIHLAAPIEAPELAALLTDAGQLKMSKGDTAWGPAPFTTEESLGMLATGRIYIAHQDGQVAGTVALSWDDEGMWGQKGLDQQAAYIHRLATGSRFRGQGIGAQIVSWVSDQASEAGRPFLRLDCAYDNRELCNYYEKLGFQETARKDLPKSQGARNPNNPVYRAALYQKSI